MSEAQEAGSARYKTGVVTAAKPGFARVQFPDLDGMVSDWLPVIFPKTLKDKVVWTLDRGEHVACLMDGTMEDGCIIGAIYSGADAPPVVSPDVYRTQFKDGGVIEYNRASGAMNVVCKGALTVICGATVTVQAPSVVIDTPQTQMTGRLTVEGDVVSTSGDVVASGTSLKQHTHSGVRAGGDQSGPPA